MHAKWTVLLCGVLGCCNPCAGRTGGHAKGKEHKEASVTADKEGPIATRAREPVLAGSWYPGDAAELRRLTEGFLQGASPPPLKAPVRALVVPHAGYRYSGPAAATAYRTVQGEQIRRVLLLGTSHRGAFVGASVLNVTHYRTPLGDIPVDTDAIGGLVDHALIGTHEQAHRREHSIEIQLPLLQTALGDGWKLLPLLVGQLDPTQAEQLADALRPFADEATLVVASGDFTHYGPNYGYVPFPSDDATAQKLKSLDDGAIEPLLARDAEALEGYKARTGITVCGIHTFQVLSYLVAPDNTGTLLTYQTSGALTGDYTNSVSYVAAAFTGVHPPSAADRVLTPEELSTLHALACRTVRKAVQERDDVDADEVVEGLELTERLERDSGAFVTLKKHGHLRGCIGIIEPRDALWRTVTHSAVSAALRDRRFKPVQPEELGELTLEVSVLSPPLEVPSYEFFRVGLHGIVLQKGARRSVYLPEVAVEQGWNREQTLSHLSRKAGLPPDAWREGAGFHIFTSQIHEAPVRVD